MLGTTAGNARNVALHIIKAVMLYVDSHTVLYKVPSILNVMLDNWLYLIVHIDSNVSKTIFHPLIKFFPFKPLQSIEDLAATMLDQKMLGTIEQNAKM